MFTAIVQRQGFSPALVAAVATVALCDQSRAAAGTPTITNLGVLPNGIASEGLAVSNHYTGGPSVTGFCFTPGAFRAFIWTPSFGMEELPPFPGASPATAGDAINADGTVVVGYSTLNGQERPTRWTPQVGGTWTGQNLGILAGGSGHSTAQGVSADGAVVVGYSPSPDGPRAVVWDIGDGTILPFGVMQGGTFSFGLGVNSAGTVFAGEGGTPQGTRAFRWISSDGFQNLGTLPGGTFSFCSGISANGQVVVGTGHVPGGQRAFRYPIATALMEDLGILPGGFFSSASATNGDGSVVVGKCELPAGPRAVLWTPDTGMVNLNTHLTGLGVDLTDWTLQRAESISPDGTSITGTGLFNGQTRAFLVTGLTGCAPQIKASGGAVQRCPGARAEFFVNLAPNNSEVTYLWRVGGLPIDPLSNPSAATSRLVIDNVSADDSGVYDCIVANACGDTTTPPVEFTVLPPDDPKCGNPCPADTDGDGVLNSADFFAFLLLFFSGLGDFNNDGVTDSEDFFDYLTAYFSGC